MRNNSKFLCFFYNLGQIDIGHIFLQYIIFIPLDSSHESDFGRNSDPVTEKTSIAVSDKYADITSLGLKHENIFIQYNYDNLGYDIQASPEAKQSFPLLNEMDDTPDDVNEIA